MTDTWEAQTSAFDRVKGVVLSLSAPRTAAWIAAEARVAENTARTHLRRLTDLGVVATTSTPDGTGYLPDPIYTRSQDVRELVEENSEEELAELAVELQVKIDGFRERYDAESPTALRASVADANLDAETARSRLTAASDWEYARFRLSLVRDGLEHYDAYVVPSRTASA